MPRLRAERYYCVLLLTSLLLFAVANGAMECYNKDDYRWFSAQSVGQNYTYQVEFLENYFKQNCFLEKGRGKAQLFDHLASLDSNSFFQGWKLEAKNIEALKYMKLYGRDGQETKYQLENQNKTAQTSFPLYWYTVTVQGSDLVVHYAANDEKIKKIPTLNEDFYISSNNGSLYFIPYKTENNFTIQELTSGGLFGGDMDFTGTLRDRIKRIHTIRQSSSNLNYCVYVYLYNGSAQKQCQEGFWKSKIILTKLPSDFLTGGYFQEYYTTYYLQRYNTWNAPEFTKVKYPNDETVTNILDLNTYRVSNGDFYIDKKLYTGFPEQPLVDMYRDVSGHIYLLYADRFIVLKQIIGSVLPLMNTYWIPEKDINKYDKIDVSGRRKDNYDTIIYLFQGQDVVAFFGFMFLEFYQLEVLSNELRNDKPNTPYFDYTLSPVKAGQATPISFRVNNFWSSKAVDDGDNSKAVDDDDNSKAVDDRGAQGNPEDDTINSTTHGQNLSFTAIQILAAAFILFLWTA